ncbi:baseplate J/gp47 family protein [Microscilla marina]|uniref:Uncharacterized protein n=1 Tax=Microscilla marina ATCC 23134 TaxID=313606 RepID=A1ZX21_MICM2|nr:baseplate J/gp47 family protein [Microscilla marina]EAY25101.1 conserved hypothetical protein [Microscilla marina ATCC 23134]
MDTIQNGRYSTSQDSRLFDGLDFDYIKLDERSLEDLLLFVSSFSKLVNFYGTNNRIDGDWSDFLNDEIIVLASIKQVDPIRAENRFRKLLDKANYFKRKDKKLQYLRLCFEEIHYLASLFEHWLMELKSVEHFANIQVNVRDDIFNAISTKLAPALQKLKAYDFLAGHEDALDTKIGLDYSSFSFYWELDKEETHSIDSVFAGASIKEKVQSLSYKLDGVFQAFYETLIYFKKKADDYIAQSFANDTHYPEIALLISFLKLYGVAQDNLNSLSKKYVDFYYRTVLRQAPKSPIHDNVYLTFDIADNALFSNIETGEKLIAGEYESGESILYEVDLPMQVNRAKVHTLKNIFIDKRFLNIRGIPKKLITNILSSDIPRNEVIPSAETLIQKNYPTFGESQMYKSVYEKTMQDAEVGFVIASPSFLLSEGKREVSITFEFDQESYKNLNQYLADISHTTEDTEEEVFIKSFIDAFLIYITGEEKWHQVSKYVVTRDKENAQLVLRFDLEPSEPAWVHYNPELHVGNFKAELPLVKVVLNSNSYIYGYSLLDALALDQINIETKVSEVKDLLMYNQEGAISPANPFYPFGAQPNRGAYLIVGKSEIFQKPLDDLAVTFEWFNLPEDNGGFHSYYENYAGLDIDNNVFEVKLSILDNGRWYPEEGEKRQMFKLFRTEEEGVHPNEPQPQGKLAEETSIDYIDISKIKLPPNYKDINDDLDYDNTTSRGFIRLELTNPPEAFGHKVYPAIVSDIAMQNASGGIVGNIKKGIAQSKPLQMPNIPMAPQVRKLTLSYSSSSAITLHERSQKNEDNSRGQFYHIYPFGDKLVYPDSSKQITPLLPEFNFEGSLLVGFTNLNPPQTVSLMFDMAEGFTISSEEDPPVIEWSYLVNDEWQVLSPSKILKDETNGFINTGIILIELPYGIQKGNTILDGNLFWLKVSVIKNIETVSRVQNISTQVTTAKLIPNEDMGSHLQKPLPAFTIDRPYGSINGIQDIIQPLESFGGQPTEKEEKFYTRISERLNHKQRAITAWDYERLILEKFPAVYKATCLPNMSSKNLDAPGSVLLVVVPETKGSKSLEPKASSDLLYDIKAYLQKFISPFTQLEIRNPAYERLKIICEIKLAEGYNYGFYIQKLNEELNKYLIGGLMANQGTVELGGKINISDVLSFMRTLPYVDFITKFSMIQVAQDFLGKFVLLDTARAGDEQSFLKATKPWSVLIPSEDHQITILNERVEFKPSQAGIDDLELGSDFIIQE